MRISPWRNGRRGIALAALTLVAACSSGDGASSAGASAGTAASTPAPAATSATGPATAGLPRPDHLIVVIFENEDAEAVLGSEKAPFLTSLAASGATFSDAHGETHPSQPNYLALFSGSTQGVTDDSCLMSFPGPDLGSQLRDAGFSFVGFAEGLPEMGSTGCRTGDYARKHNPWVDFADLPPSVNQPLSAMPADYAQLPTVSFVVPGLCHDMHDCGVTAGDDWAARVLDPYASWAREHNSLLLVTFDEDSGSKNNHIATFVVGAGVRRTTSERRIDHYDLLRTMEEMYGLAPLGKAADATPIIDVWGTPGG